MLRERCHRATEELGKQLWSVAQYIEYRLALEAPGEVAGSVLTPGVARFALGPLTEVAASTHTWDELVDALEEPAVAAAVAQERVLRGEDLTADERAHGDELDLPLVLQPWEPVYPVPTYRHGELLEDGPDEPTAGYAEADAVPGPPGEVAELEAALRDVVDPWVTQSNGRCHVAAVRGGAAAAVAALLGGRFRLAPLSLDEVCERIAWAAASGGALGRRRGMAFGRSQAFWVLHVATGLDFPADPAELAAEANRLRWFAFDDGADVGWTFRMAIEHPDGWALAVDATDDDELDDPLALPGA